MNVFLDSLPLAVCDGSAGNDTEILEIFPALTCLEGIRAIKFLGTRVATWR
jgi:hypothetical protein